MDAMSYKASTLFEIDLVTSIYQPDACSPMFYPFAAENADALAEMPRTFFQIYGLDPVRDDGLVYERVFAGAGGRDEVAGLSRCASCDLACHPDDGGFEKGSARVY